MNLKSKVLLLLLCGILASQISMAQNEGARDRSKTMETLEEQQNKEVVRRLYEEMMNQRKLELLSQVISKDYSDGQNGNGATVFQKGIVNVIDAFPDALWRIDELVAEGSKVIVKQTVTGTHTHPFNGIKGTGNHIENQGYVTYTLDNGKITAYSIMTDRLGFLQQLGVIPKDIGPPKPVSNPGVYFVDRFTIPIGAYPEFKEKLALSRSIIKDLPGFIEDKVMVKRVENHSVHLMTIAAWQSPEDFENAKNLAMEAYKKHNFNPKVFTEQLGIQREREVYKVF